MDSDEQPQTDAIEAGTSVSLYVPYQVTVTNPPTDGYSFFRLGQPDTATEDGLPDDATQPATPGDGATSYPAGALLYTTGGLQITAPTTVVTSPNVTINTLDPTTNPPSFSVGAGVSFVSPSSFNMVLNGSQLCSAVLTTSGQAASPFHNRAVTATYQNVDTFTLSEGEASNFLTGDAQTFWTGNDQSIGFGGLLWANAGITSNLFGGMIINVTNSGIKIDGLGEYEVNTTFDKAAAAAVSLRVTPGAAATIAAAAKLTLIMNGLQAVATLAGGVFSGYALGEINAKPHDINSLQDQMTKTNTYLEAMSDIVIGVQAASIILALLLQLTKLADEATATSQLDLNEGSARLSALGSRMTMEAGVTLEANDPAFGFVTIQAQSAVVAQAEEAISLMCGGGVTRIDISDASIALVSGENSIIVSPMGVTINATTFNVNALETSFAPAVTPPPIPNLDAEAAIAMAVAQIAMVAAE